MRIVRYVVSRILKLAGNLSKGAFFAVHAIRPSLRLTIPERAGPLVKTTSNHSIPRIVWQTNFSRRVSLNIYANYLFNRIMAPTFEFRLLDDDGIAAFIATCDGRTQANYARLQIGAARADFWRLLTVNYHGGVYMDMDAGLVWPLGFTLGDRRELYITDQGDRVTNYFFASASSSPLIEDMVLIVNQNIEEGVLTSVWDITGPAVLGTVLRGRDVSIEDRRITCVQGLITNEFFQYLDRPAGKWTKEQQTKSVTSPN
ncbi:MAG: mannosyltransferase [Mesorhizobium sp.]|nr:glycosyltransferase [Mesorhizobium sp.]MBL8579964.1 mannosyltransferase [Mesorhizobium sp.]